MDGNMVNGITLRVSFARRQNQCGDSGRFRSSKSFDRSNDDDDRSSGDRSNRFRSERSNRFRGNEHAHFRGEKRGRGRGRTCESGNFLLPAVSAENNDDFWSGASKVSSDERPTAEAPHDKDDFWPAGKRSPGKTSDRSSVERDNKEGDGFDTYKSTISASERDVDKKDDDFDTYKPFSNDGRSDSSNTCSRGTVDGENFGKRHSGLEHMGGERRGGFGNDKYRSFRGDRRGGGMPRRSNRSRGSLLWQSRKRSNELKGVDYCSTGNLDISHRSPWPTRADIGAKDDFWTSGDAHSKSDSDNRESELQEKGYGKSDFWPTSSHHSSSRGDESWPFSVEKSDGEQPLRGSTRGDYKSGRREGDRGGGFRRQPRDLDDKIVWPDDEEGKSSCCDGWPDVDSKPSPDSWPASSDDKMPSSPPPPPPMSDVQVAWSEASKSFYFYY